MHCIGVRHQFVENFRPLRELFVVLPVLVEQSDGLAVTPLCVFEILPCPINVAEGEQQHTLLDTVPCRFGVAPLVSFDSLQGVLLRHVNVTHGIVHLIEIILVVLVARHALQLAHHLLPLSASHNLCHGNACIEFQFVGRVLPYHFPVSVVSLLGIAELFLQLSHDIPFPRPLLASSLMADYLAQIRHGFGIPSGFDIVVGVGVVPVLHRLPRQRVTLDFRNHVLRVVEPVLLRVASCEPRPRLAVDGRLCGVEAAHIRERGCRFLEFALHELRPAHEQPRLPDKGVVFLSVQPFYVLCGFLPRLVPFRAFPYAV